MAETEWNHGTCPRCGEHKFIGHGPLCVDCYAAPTSPDTDEEQAHG